MEDLLLCLRSTWQYIGASTGAQVGDEHDGTIGWTNLEGAMNWARTAVGMLALVALTACGGTSRLDGATNTPTMAPDLPTITQAALADAAGKSGLDMSQLRVESAASVTWPDGSLGCPSPGMAYTQALVPGYRIRIRAGDMVLDYHASSRGQLILCPPERATDPLPDDRI